MARIFLFSLFLHLTLVSWASAGVLGPIPGLVARESSSYVATDLLYQGKNITVNQALELRKKGLDLSTLDPQESDIWGKHKTPIAFDALTIKSAHAVKYVNTTMSPQGMFRFVGSIKEQHEAQISYTFILSKDSNNILMRKALLEKLGYRVPPIKRLQYLFVNFDNNLDKKSFLDSIEAATGSVSKAWAIKNQERRLLLQDVLVTSNNDLIYNLALGNLTSEVIDGRRVFNSLITPFALAYVPESVNLFNWQGSQIISNHIRFDFIYKDEYSPSFDDVRWIGRKLLRLNRADWQEIAKAGLFPKEVEMVVAEKLIARRNRLCIHLELKCQELKFNPHISYGKYLVKGKILARKFKGHAQEYAYGDPEGPLSGSEMLAFAESKGLSLAVTNLIGQFNKYVMPKNDFKGQIYDYQQKMVSKQFEEFLKTGKVKKAGLSFFALPTWGVNLIVSRDIIAGTYLGTDNIVQLADNFGMSASLGAFIGLTGLPIPIGLSSTTAGHVTRVYSHVRPIKSIKKALREPLYNMMVEIYRQRTGRILDDVVYNPNFNKLPKDEQNKKIAQALKIFYNKLAIGESLIITDSIGAGVGVNAHYNFTQWLRTGATFNSSQIVVGRVHILRKDENTIQVYKDRGAFQGNSFNFSFSAVMPILQFEAYANSANTTTNFYTLDLTANVDDNPKVVKNLRAVRRLIVNNSSKLLKATQEPYKVGHALTESGTHTSFLWQKWDKKNLKDLIWIQHPKGPVRYFYRDFRGTRKGTSWQDLATDAINGILSTYTETDIGISNPSNGNPGDTFLGKSQARHTYFEAEIEGQLAHKSQGKVKSDFVGISYIWKGWEISKSKANKIIKDLMDRYQTPLYSPLALHNTEKIQLYSILFNIYVYSDGLDMMSKQDDKSLRSIWYYFGRNIKKPVYRPRGSIPASKMSLVLKHIRHFKKLKDNYLKALKTPQTANVSSRARKMVDYAEKNLDLKGMAYLVGGKRNLYAESRIQGFRIGEEVGDETVMSDSFGEFGSENVRGPIQAIKNSIDMTDGEFFISWLVTPL